MPSNYPASLDSLSTTNENPTKSENTHPALHNDANDAINKIETELGTEPSGASATVAAAIAAKPTATLDTDGTLAANSDTKVASQKATKTYVDLRELLSNKDTTGTLGTSDTKYPSQKAVKTYVDAEATARTTDVNEEETRAKAAEAAVKALLPVYNVEDATYGAKRDAFFTDGVANGTTTFTSATAAFVGGDVGKNIVVLRAGPSQYQDLHTTISEVLSATEVKLTNAAGRSQSSCRFYISRSGDQAAAIQAAVDAAAAAGGGTVYLPGVGYLVASSIVLKNRVWLEGAGEKATMLHLAGSSNVPVVKKDETENNSAQGVGVRNMWIDGNRLRQTAITTTLTEKYTVGGTVLKLTSAAAFQNSGSVTIGTNRLTYIKKNGNTLEGVVGGREGSTDAEGAAAATVTQYNSHGIHFAPVPYNTAPTLADSSDVTKDLIENVFVKNVNGDGVSTWGWSETRIHNVLVAYPDQIGIRPSFDTWVDSSTVEQSGRIGFYWGQSEQGGSNCKAYFCGGNTAAEGWGHLVEGPTTIEEGTKRLIGFSAQDNKADGYYLRTAQRVLLTGTASSNGTSSAGTYVGAKIEGCTNGIVDLVCTERVASPNNTQRNALNILTTGGGLATTGMTIRISHGAVNASEVLAAIKSGSVYAGNKIEINGLPIDTAGTVAVTTKQEFTATAFSNITALTFPVLANGVYKFKAFIVFQTSVTTTAARIGVNGPTLTTLAALSRKQITAGGTASTDMFSEAILSAYDTALPASTDEIEATKNLIQEIEGTIVCSANGTVAIRMAKDVEAGTITVQPGSFLEFRRLDVANI